MIWTLAHVGHWLADVAYAAPVLVLLGWLGVARLKDNRARRRTDADAT